MSPGRPILKRRNSNAHVHLGEDEESSLSFSFDSSLVLDSPTRRKNVQFSPSRDAIAQVFETHSAEVYDRKPIKPSPLSPDELQGENSPSRFLDPARRKVLQAQRPSSTRVTRPEETRPDPQKWSNRRESFRVESEDVIFEEDEENDDSHALNTRTKFIPMAPLRSPPLTGSFPRGAVGAPNKLGNTFSPGRGKPARNDFEKEMDEFFASSKPANSRGKPDHPVLFYLHLLFLTTDVDFAVGQHSQIPGRR